MAEGGAKAKKEEPVEYDGDQKLLAYLGAVALVIGAVFWLLVAVRLWGASPAAPLAAAFVPACGVFFLMAWGVRTKMEQALPLTRWEVRRLQLAGLLLGVVVGALPYLALGFKLEDPGVLNVAAEPSDTPPAWR